MPIGTYFNSDSFSRIALGKQVTTVVKYGQKARISEGNPLVILRSLI